MKTHIRDVRTYGMYVLMDSGDTICPQFFNRDDIKSVGQPEVII